MQYIVKTDKTIDQVVTDLEVAVPKYGFGILHIHDLKQTMNNKGIEFSNDCKIIEICNPYKAEFILSRDMNLSVALPCRISVYKDNETIKIGTILPSFLVGALSNNQILQVEAKEVEKISKNIIDEVK